MKIPFLTLILSLTLLTAAQAQTVSVLATPPNTAAQVLATIETTRALLTKNDVRKIAALMTSDAQIQEGHEKSLSREQWLRHELEGAKNSPPMTGTKAVFDIVRVDARSGDAKVKGRLYFSFSMAPRAGAKPAKWQFSGLINAVLRNENGVWKWRRLQLIPVSMFVDGKPHKQG